MINPQELARAVNLQERSYQLLLLARPSLLLPDL
jgi:hypothetical protein